MNKETYDVFISYKSEERPEALHIKNFLQANGVSCWMDQDQIKIGQDYEKVIAAIMPKCRAIVLLLSYASQQSKEVQIEYELARRNNALVFPIKIKDCDLTEYYDKEFRHTQVAKTYWNSEKEKQIVLCSIRDQIYIDKDEPVKTELDFLEMRIDHYQDNLQRIYDELENSWDQIVMKSLERSFFLTPEPHYIKAVTKEAVSQYQDLVGTYIEDIINNSPEISYLVGFCEFVQKRDIVTKAWISFDEFKRLAFRVLSYLDRKDERDNIFVLRQYKDYLFSLSESSFVHPIVKLLEQLYERERVKYELVLSKLLSNNASLFVARASAAIFIHPRYIGVDYINIASQVVLDDNRAVFRPENVVQPHWTDFIRKHCCDVYIREIDKNSGASGLISFSIEHALFTCDEKLNYMYLYLIRRLIENGKPEYVKILLRNMGAFDWDQFVSNTKEEISKLKRFVYCCMYENGYQREYIKKLWIDA